MCQNANNHQDERQVPSSCINKTPSNALVNAAPKLPQNFKTKIESK